MKWNENNIEMKWKYLKWNEENWSENEENLKMKREENEEKTWRRNRRNEKWKEINNRNEENEINIEKRTESLATEAGESEENQLKMKKWKMKWRRNQWREMWKWNEIEEEEIIWEMKRNEEKQRLKKYLKWCREGSTESERNLSCSGCVTLLAPAILCQWPASSY